MKTKKILSTMLAVCLMSVTMVANSDGAVATTGKQVRRAVTFQLGTKIWGQQVRRNVTFELKAPILKLTQVPIFDFGNRRQAGQRVDLPSAQQLIVHDELHASWRVTMSFDDHEFEANHLALKLTPKVSSPELSAGKSRTLNGGEVNVEQVATTSQHTTQRGDYVVDYENNSDNQLIVPNTAKTGDYKTVMTWNLESVPNVP